MGELVRGTAGRVARLLLLTAALCTAATDDGSFFESKVRPVLATQSRELQTKLPEAAPTDVTRRSQ